jgi:hypothetical protein
MPGSIITVAGVTSDTVGGLKESLARTRKHYQEVGDALLNISGIGTEAGVPVDKDDPRPPYAHQHFPRMVYHAEKGELTVQGDKELTEAKKAGYRLEPYPKLQIAVADAATEKKAQSDIITRMEGMLRAQAEQIEKLTAQITGRGV